MNRKKVLGFVLCFLALLSVSLNLYFLIPKPHSTSISKGYYASMPPNAASGQYSLSIYENNDVVLYGSFSSTNKPILKGKLEFNEQEKDYLLKTDSATYRVIAQDNTFSLPVTENGITSSRLFTRAGDGVVTYG